MKRISILCFAFATLGCSSDGVEENSNTAFFKTAILGSWTYDTIKIEGQTFAYQHKENCEPDSFHFYNQEGMPFFFEERTAMDCSSCAECAISQIYLVWKLKGDRLQLFYGDALALTYTILSVSEEKLTYQVTADYNNDGKKELLEFTALRIFE